MPFSSRILAAIMDFSVCYAAFWGLAKLIDLPDDPIFLWLALAGLYYTIGNSAITRGRTLGKLFFGLQVLSASDNNIFLSLGRAFLRFFFMLGILVLGDISLESLYRYYVVTGPLYLLTFHKFLLYLLFFSGVSLFFFHPRRRTVHDFIAGSVVVRPSVAKSGKMVEGRFDGLRVIFSVLVALVLSLVGWLGSIDPDPDTSNIRRIRYRLESTFPLRIVEVAKTKDHVVIFALDLEADSADSLPAGSKQGREEWAVVNWTKFVVEEGAVNLSSFKTLGWVLAPPNRRTEPLPQLILYKVDLQTLAVGTAPFSMNFGMGAGDVPAAAGLVKGDSLH